MTNDNVFFCVGLVFTTFMVSSSLASPTIVDVRDIQTSSTSEVYTDSANASVLWVTPPSSGSLQISQSGLSVDQSTCETVAALNEIKLNMLERQIALDEQLKAYDLYRSQVGWDREITIEEKQATIAFIEGEMSKINEIRDQISDEFKLYSVPEHLLESGGYYSIIADTGWGEAVDVIRTENQMLTVQPIQTADAKLNISILDADGFKSTELIADVHSENLSNITAAADSFQIDVEPTKIGACFLAYPQLVGGRTEPYAFGISLNYTHPYLLSTTIEADYNLLDIYDLLVETRTRKGFFRSKSYSTTIESRTTTELFSLRIIYEQDVDEETKLRDEARVKEFLISYAASQMNAEIGVAPDPGETGAAIAGQQLMQSCGANAYCAGAAAALTVLDGIFGGSDNINELRQTLNITKTYRSSVSEAVQIPKVISFTYSD